MTTPVVAFTATAVTAAPTVTINIPNPLFVGGSVPITGTISDPTSFLYICWRTVGTPLITDGDVVQAIVSLNGTWTANLNIDHPGVQSTFWYFTSPTASTTAGGHVYKAVTPVQGSSVTASVVQPASLVTGNNLFSGTVSDPNAIVQVEWYVGSGTPSASDLGVVTAAVTSNGNFSVQVNVGNSGVSGQLVYFINGGAPNVAFTATPGTGTDTGSGGNTPTPFTSAATHTYFLNINGVQVSSLVVPTSSIITLTGG